MAKVESENLSDAREGVSARVREGVVREGVREFE